MKKYQWLVGILVFLIVVGCTTPPTPGTQPAAQMPAIQPTEAPQVAVPAGAEALVQPARDALAGRLGVSSKSVALVEVEPAQWSSSAMGCPDPNMMYAQVITEGYVMRWEVDGEAYETHVGGDGRVVFCDRDEGEEPVELKVPTAAEPAVAAARRDLASRMGVDAKDVLVEAFETVQWPDSSLGCPEPGKMYAQVITPGYQVILRAGEQTYEYHTNRGERVVYCGEMQKAAVGMPMHLQEMKAVMTRARNELARTKELDPASISITDVAPVAELEQPASCPEASTLAGSGTEYQVVLQAGGETYVYRAKGDTLVLCSP